MVGRHITGAVLKKLHHPKAGSHKGDNGRLLLIAGSKKYHGSLALAAAMASKLADLVYVHTTRENFTIIKKLRERLAEFIYISSRDFPPTLKEVDAILMGPGMLPNKATRRLTLRVLKQAAGKPVVLDAAAIRVIKPRELTRYCVVTPHAGEFQALFHCAPTPANVKKMSARYPAVIVLKGPADYIGQGGSLWKALGGNAGMTKGGTGDVLAGLIAALVCKNPPLLAAQAAVYLNKQAGDRLYKKFGFAYSAGELVPEVQKTLGKICR